MQLCLMISSGVMQYGDYYTHTMRDTGLKDGLPPCQGHGPPRSANLENFLNNYSALTLMTLPAGWLHHSALCLCWFIFTRSAEKWKKSILDEPHLMYFLALIIVKKKFEKYS